MSTQLVTYDQAKQHLRLSTDLEQTDVELKIAQATAFVLTYVQRQENEWTADTDPTTDLPFSIVQGAILYLLGAYFRKRGDDTNLRPEDPAWGAFLESPLRQRLTLLRRPSFA